MTSDRQPTSTAVVGRPEHAKARDIASTSFPRIFRVTPRLAATLGTVWGEPGQQLTLTGTVAHDAIDTAPANDTAAATIRIQPVPPSTTASTTSTTRPSGGGGFLPTTGSGAVSVAIVAALLLAGGIVLRSAGWRRPRRQP